MSSLRGRCYDECNRFCCICDDYAVKEQRKPITDLVKRAYYGYFGIKPELRILYVKQLPRFYDCDRMRKKT